MKRRAVITLGLVSPVLVLSICVAGTVLVGAAGWFLFRPADKARLIQIIPLAPLSAYVVDTPAPEPLPQTDDDPPGNTAAPLPAAVQPDAQSPAEPAAMPVDIPTPTPEVEEVREFNLPPGTVNSVTGEGVATRLVVPKLGLDAPVVVSPIKNQTWQVDHLGQAVGHLEGTAAPGSNSNMVLAGHVTLAEGVYGPFAGLGQLSPGDEMIVYQGNKTFTYIVDGYDIVDRTAIEVTYPTNTGLLTLITCSKWNNDTGRYEQRLVVRGHLAGG